MKVSRGLLAIASIALAVPVCAQSLGDLAKKEQERRKAAPAAARTYTDEDLKKITVPGAVTAPSDAGAKPAEGAGKADDAKPGAAKGDDKAGEKAGEKATEPVKDEAA